LETELGKWRNKSQNLQTTNLHHHANMAPALQRHKQVLVVNLPWPKHTNLIFGCAEALESALLV